MERINQYSFYGLGQTLQKARNFSGDVKSEEALWDLNAIFVAIRELLNGKPIPLGVSRAAAAEVYRSIDNIFDNHYRGPPKEDGTRDFKWPSEDDAPIPGWRLSSLHRTLGEFETVFAAEMAEATTYYISQKGIYYTPGLVDRADDSFPEDLKPFISDKTKADWKAAGRCLALNLCTAAGFHVVRAVEGTLEAYYQKFTNQPGKTEVGWHDYLVPLEKLPPNTDPAPDPKTIAVLRQMKDDYRNPVVHPRVVLTEADTRMLFNNGESAIIGMAQGMKEAARSPQGALALIATGAS